MKISELTGPELDYWIAKAEGLHIDGMRPECIVGITPNRYVYSPSTNWVHAGPIIDRENISLDSPNRNRGITVVDGVPTWVAHKTTSGPFIMARGATPLIAAMRCYVSSKYGEDVPKAVSDDGRLKAPWQDYEGRDIYEGSIIEHRSGQRGTVVYLLGENDPADQWRVRYEDDSLSRLALQIGEKGQAIVVKS